MSNFYIAILQYTMHYYEGQSKVKVLPAQMHKGTQNNEENNIWKGQCWKDGNLHLLSHALRKQLTWLHYPLSEIL